MKQYMYIDKFIKSLNFLSCVLAPCLCYRCHHGQLALICVYVDDIIICTSDLKNMVEIKSRFLDRYDMTNMGRLTSFMNIRVMWEETGVRLDQQRYAEKVLCRHAGLVGTSIKKNPLPSNAIDILADDTGNYSTEQSEFVRMFPYRKSDAISGYAYETECRIRSRSAVATMQAIKSGGM